MAYNKPIEIKVISQNTKGTEVNAVKLLDTIEKQLKTVLKEGDLFKSPKASVDYNTHNVTKSFFVQSDAEKIVRDIINLKKDIFYKAPSITSREATTRKYKVDVEGDRALAALNASAASHGGRTYGNQHGTYIEVPAYSGVRSSVASKAENITKEQRNKANEEAERFLDKEQRETKLLEEAKLAAIEKEKEEQKKKQGKTADKWNKLTKAQEKSVQDEIDAYFAAEEKSKVVEATKAEADARSEKVKRAKAESAMNNKWQKLLYKRDADVAAEEAKRAAEEEKVKKEVAKFFKKEDDSAAAGKARQEAKESAIEAREKEAHARELKRKEASMFRLITKREETEVREERKAQKEKEREEIKKQKEAEKEERQKEKEDRQEEASKKQRSVALMSKLAISVLLLKKLISLVENITTSIIEQGQKSFETSLTAQKLNLSPDILLKLEYAGIAKGIGSAPINAMLSLQDSFGSTLLAAENINKLKNIMPIIGDDVEKLILNGVVGTNPLGMKTMLMDKFLGAYHAKSNGLGGTTKTKEASLASLITLATEAFGDDFAVEFNRAALDNATDYSDWLTAAMPVSTPSYNVIKASGENYEQYNETLTGLKAVMEELKMTLSVVFNPLTEAIQLLTSFVRKLLGDSGEIAESNRQNYEKAQVSYERDKAEKAKFDTVINDYLELNKDKFGGEEATKTAMAAFLDRHKIPERLEGDEEGIEEFFTAALAYSVSRQFEKNLKKSGEAIEDYESNYKFETGDKTLTFFDTVPSQTMSVAQRKFNAASWQYTASRIKDVKPYSEEEAEVASIALTEVEAETYRGNLEAIAEQKAIIKEEEAKSGLEKFLEYGILTFMSERKIKKAKGEIEKLEKANRVYDDKIQLYKDFDIKPLSSSEEEDDYDYLFGSLGGSSTYISPEAANELGANALKNLIERLYVGALQKGESYKFLREENQTAKLTIQIIDKDGNERKRIEVPEDIASAFNETIPFYLQGEN